MNNMIISITKEDKGVLLCDLKHNIGFNEYLIEQSSDDPDINVDYCDVIIKVSTLLYGIIDKIEFESDIACVEVMEFDIYVLMSALQCGIFNYRYTIGDIRADYAIFLDDDFTDEDELECLKEGIEYRNAFISRLCEVGRSGKT